MDLAVEQLKKLLNIEDKDISIPPKNEMGDLSTNIAFELSKEKKENPNITAIKIMSKLDLSKTFFSKVKAFGPYINFYINYEKLSKKVLTDVLKNKNYGFLKKNSKTILFEFPNPNTNKPLHLGHLLQILLGTSLSRIMIAKGFDVKRLNVYNDRGIHICQSIVAYMKWGRNKEPNIKSDHFVGKYYVMFNKKKSDKLQKDAEEVLVKWENNDKEIRNVWKKMNSWAYKGFEETFKKLGMDKYDKIYYESDFYNDGKEIVLKGLKKSVFNQEEDGAIYAQLSDDSKKYLLRKNNTTLYITQDLALAKLKEKDFKFEKSIYMTANEQNHYFKQLFEILKMLKFKSANKLIHLGTGYISLPTGKMKSREGLVVDIDDLIEKMVKLAKKEVKKRKSKISEENIEKIALAAIKYYVLKTTSTKDTVFNPNESISFEGNTGPYILYSLVRAKKIILKSKKSSIKSFDAKNFEKKEEFNLIKSFSSFTEQINKSYENLSPHTLCNYAFKIAKEFNSFYENCPVLDAENDSIINSRLAIIHSFIKIMEKTLYLLGIESVNEM